MVKGRLASRNTSSEQRPAHWKIILDVKKAALVESETQIEKIQNFFLLIC